MIVYPFPDSDVADMFEQLIEKRLIQLPKCKRPEQAGKVDDPNYCKYHWVISHHVENCFVLKELILKLARENKIELDIDEVVQTNHVTIEMASSVPPSTQLYDQRKSLTQFGTFEPIVVSFQQKIVLTDSQNKEEPIVDDDKGRIVKDFIKAHSVARLKTSPMLHRLRGLHYYFSMSKIEGFINASSYSSSKASSTLPHIQAQRLH
ncbi:retrotransposon gag protein [Cucumis melo var. makuwa]|uniref:Retrotransposon gag protein n=1 Tax=Cucumis melo var. makuwa TaxID=1194695 RepID=A0A5A7VPS0_CUCMM|nr:retrotransposon gag protein [Cucumis melo var. makuwa]